MAPSLVALHPQCGELLGQWRLDDTYLSIRQLAREPRAQRLGIDLQAERPAPEDRLRAPVLAVFDSQARWSHQLPLPEACAVAVGDDQWWAGGGSGELGQPLAGLARGSNNTLIDLCFYLRPALG